VARKDPDVPIIIEDKLTGDEGQIQILVFLQSQLALLSQLCFDRNYIAIDHLRPLYPMDLLLHGFKSTFLPSFSPPPQPLLYFRIHLADFFLCFFFFVFFVSSRTLRSSFCSLLLSLYVDCDPQKKISPLLFTRVWDELDEVVQDQYWNKSFFLFFFFF